MGQCFEGKTVFITGASLGVGLASAQAFHAAGANVAMVARRSAPLEAAAQGLERALVLRGDVADAGAMEKALAAAVAHFGALHGVVNNAGAHFRGPMEGRTAAEVAAMVDVNLRAPLVITRLALPYLRDVGGFVVNVASLAGKVPLDGAATYSATKFGLRAFTYAMAEETRGSNVTFSVVSPGPIRTGFILADLDEVEDITLSQTLCDAEDVARLIIACATDGRVERCFPVGGGRLATLAYLFPAIRRLLKPRLAAKGRRVKARIRRERREP